MKEPGPRRVPAYVGKRDLLVTDLRQSILSGQIKVGQRLRQEDLAVRYGTSATPVREAFRILEAQGLVAYEPHRGVRVKDFGGGFDQIYRLREALEGLAVEMAVSRLEAARISALFAAIDRMSLAEQASDDIGRRDAHRQFHVLLYEGCEFPALVEMIQIVWTRFPWDELLHLPGLSSIDDHRRIAELAREGDATGAADALRAHLESVRGQVIEVAKGRSADPEIASA